MGNTIGIETKVPRSNSSLLRAHSRSSFSRLVMESEASMGTYANSLPFFMCQMVVITFRLVTPLSYVGVLACFFDYLTPDMLIGPLDGRLVYWLILTLMITETLFFPYYLYLFTHVSNRNEDMQHYMRCASSRMKLVENCFDAMMSSGQDGGLVHDPSMNPQTYLRKVLEGWHLDTSLSEIYRDNFGQWCAWAFWDKNLNELLTSEKKELDSIVSFVEERVQWKFEPGFNKNVRNARLTLDPVFVTQRPFFFYATIWILNSFCHLVLHLMGFRLEQGHCCVGQNVYRRKGTGPKGTRLPIFFMHGLGIGFVHYLMLLWHLPRDVDLFLLEWPHVCMQLTTDVPRNEDTTRLVSSVLDAHGHKAACFLAHSLGTTAVSWLLADEATRSIVAATVMLDPIVFLLCDPTVATNFVYKPPRNTVDFLMHFFLSRELFISRALSRHFNWSHNILFIEDLFQDRGKKRERTPSKADDFHIGVPLDCSSSEQDESPNPANSILHTIILSSDDGIVPIVPVSQYLHNKSNERAAQGRPNFEVKMFHGQHGEMMMYLSWVRKIAADVDCKL
jgi:pimeloyl-ACP methyl ester carboxylesterase